VFFYEPPASSVFMASATLSGKSDDFDNIYGIGLFQNENALCVV
jgi:hypothetical protein